MEREARRAVPGSMWIIRERRTAQRPLPGQWEQSKGNKLKAGWKGLRSGWLWGQQWEQLWTAYTIRLPALPDTPRVPLAAGLRCPYSKLPSSLWRPWFPYPKKAAPLFCPLHSNPGLLLLYLWLGYLSPLLKLWLLPPNHPHLYMPPHCLLTLHFPDTVPCGCFITPDYLCFCFLPLLLALAAWVWSPSYHMQQTISPYTVLRLISLLPGRSLEL